MRATRATIADAHPVLRGGHPTMRTLDGKWAVEVITIHGRTVRPSEQPAAGPARDHEPARAVVATIAELREVMGEDCDRLVEDRCGRFDGGRQQPSPHTTDSVVLGSYRLYMTGTPPHPDDEDGHEHCRDQLSEAQDLIADLQAALITARRIGTAIGILMNQHKITDEAAFHLLCSASQNRNRKLRDIAEQVVLTGEI